MIIPVPLTFFQMDRPWQKFHYYIKGNEILPGQDHCMLAGLQCDL
jgi:hypothetical protein